MNEPIGDKKGYKLLKKDLLTVRGKTSMLKVVSETLTVIEL
jgi:hypothetical protein